MSVATGAKNSSRDIQVESYETFFRAATALIASEDARRSSPLRVFIGFELRTGFI